MVNSFEVGVGSVLVGAHDGEHARRNVRVGGVFGAAIHVEGVVIDLEEVGLSLDSEVAEVVLAVRVIVLREIAEGLNRQKCAGFGVYRQGIDALRHGGKKNAPDDSEAI